MYKYLLFSLGTHTKRIFRVCMKIFSCLRDVKQTSLWERQCEVTGLDIGMSLSAVMHVRTAWNAHVTEWGSSLALLDYGISINSCAFFFLPFICFCFVFMLNFSKNSFASKIKHLDLIRFELCKRCMLFHLFATFKDTSRSEVTY